MANGTAVTNLWPSSARGKKLDGWGGPVKSGPVQVKPLLTLLKSALKGIGSKPDVGLVVAAAYKTIEVEGSVTMLRLSTETERPSGNAPNGENVNPWSVLTNRPLFRVATYTRFGTAVASVAIALTLAWSKCPDLLGIGPAKETPPSLLLKRPVLPLRTK